MSLLKGSSQSIIGSNIAELQRSGRDERQSVAIALSTARDQAPKPKKRKSTHKNLGKHLHPRKDGKEHGSD
jgi:hypothetical protein